MKTSSILFLLSLLTLVGFAQRKSDPPKMVLVPGNDEVKAFYMDQYELTIAEFAEFVEATGYVTEGEKIGGIMLLKSGGVWEVRKGETWNTYSALSNRGVDVQLDEEPEFKNLPVMNLAPADVFAYAKWAGKRVPTRDEWLHAAKAAQKEYPYTYPGGNNLRKVAWYEGNTDSWFPKKVGTKEPNELGIYDLSGNAAELVISAIDPLEFQILGGTFYSSKMWLEMGRKLAFQVEITRPVGALGVRLVKNVD